MSIQTWKLEFYPIPASTVPKDEAVQHALQKWKGYLQESLDKHEVKLNDVFSFSAGSCALCGHYFFNGDDVGKDNCPRCPLAAVKKCCLDDDSPYHRIDLVLRVFNPSKVLDEVFQTQGTTDAQELVTPAIQAMVDALEEALAYEQPQPREETDEEETPPQV